MADAIDRLFQFHHAALNARALRQQVLASNIANADTPGYKARDVDFAAALRQAAGGAQPLATSQAGHQPGRASEAQSVVGYRQVEQPSLDGNTVDMDVERNRFAENAVHYDANLTFLNSQIKLMLSAIQG